MDVKYYWEIKDFIAKNEPLKQAVIEFSYGRPSWPNINPGLEPSKDVVHVTRRFDRWSPTLFRYAADGRHFPQVILKTRKFNGNTPVAHGYTTLGDVHIENYVSQEVPGETDHVIDVVTLGFKTVTYEIKQ